MIFSFLFWFVVIVLAICALTYLGLGVTIYFLCGYREQMGFFKFLRRKFSFEMQFSLPKKRG